MQEAAIAGSQAVTFTATDRKVIEERSGGEVNKALSFLEVFSQKQPLSPKVENEQSTVKPRQDIKELEGRYKDHHSMLKHSTLIIPHERVEITGETPETLLMKEGRHTPTPEQLPKIDDYEKQKEKRIEPETKAEEKTEIHLKTAAIAKELNLNPSEIFDKFSLEQNELYSLVTRIKELHLKRLLCNTREEFTKLSEEIKKETLASARDEARTWLESQLSTLTRGAAQYKLSLLRSLKAMHYDDEKDENVKWLQEVVVKLSRS